MCGKITTSSLGFAMLCSARPGTMFGFPHCHQGKPGPQATFDGLVQQIVTNSYRNGKNGRNCLDEVFLPTNLDEHAQKKPLLVASSVAIHLVHHIPPPPSPPPPTQEPTNGTPGRPIAVDNRSAGLLPRNPRSALLGAWAQQARESALPRRRHTSARVPKATRRSPITRPDAALATPVSALRTRPESGVSEFLIDAAARTRGVGC